MQQVWVCPHTKCVCLHLSSSLSLFLSLSGLNALPPLHTHPLPLSPPPPHTHHSATLPRSECTRLAVHDKIKLGLTTLALFPGVRVYMCGCLHVLYMPICVGTCLYVWVHACMCGNMHTGMCGCMPVCVAACLYGLFKRKLNVSFSLLTPHPASGTLPLPSPPSPSLPPYRFLTSATH